VDQKTTQMSTRSPPQARNTANLEAPGPVGGKRGVHAKRRAHLHADGSHHSEAEVRDPARRLCSALLKMVHARPSVCAWSSMCAWPRDRPRREACCSETKPAAKVAKMGPRRHPRAPAATRAARQLSTRIQLNDSPRKRRVCGGASGARASSQLVGKQCAPPCRPGHSGRAEVGWGRGALHHDAQE
jgi:hypothetical protein